MAETNEERDVRELTETFDKWFTRLLHKTETCLEREVLRECRKELKAQWLVIRPTYTTTELETAESIAKKLRERLFDEKAKV